MIRKYFNLEGWHKAMNNPVLHMCSVFIALVFALIIGSTGQTHPVQAASNRVMLRWYMEVVNPKTTLCIGETVEYSVKVNYVYSIEPRSEWATTGIVVDALSSNKSVGDFKNNRVITGFADIDLATASFSFTARKPGNVKLFFEGMVDRQDTSSYVEFTVPVKVIPCKFKVIAASNWSASYPGLTSTLVANLMGAMTVDEQGHYAGTANVTWSATAISPMCRHRQTFSPGRAHLTGYLSDDGTKLSVFVEYDPVTVNQGNCASTVTPQVQVPPLETAVPVRGGTLTYAQSMRVGAMDFNGHTVVTVIPLDGAQ